jgi:hypothetical protein
MSQATIERILEDIKRLSYEERVLLGQRLDEISEADFKEEARKAGEIARANGIDQAAIDRAIERLRYGK